MRAHLKTPITGGVTAAVIAAALALLPAGAFAQTAAGPAPAGAGAAASYPSKPITIVVGFSAGGTTDIIARLIAERLVQAWGQPVVIENRSGAAGNIAADHVAKSRPDGYTLLVGSVGPLAVNASLYKRMPYDNLKDLAPVTLIADVPNMLVVNARTVPAKSVAEFVALAKANPKKFFFASTGSGTSAHLSGELFNQFTGTDLTHVPYKGAVALNDVLAGDAVQCMFATIPSAIQHVKGGRLRALAVTSARRSAGVPDVPTMAESGWPGFDASSWFGMVGPAGLPREIAGKLQAEIARALKDPVVREKFVSQGADPVGNTPEEFAEYIRAETAKWAKIVKTSGATVD
jgi:tripartite-type tricarboxylate transporter receptor subunit TctC